MLAEEVLLVNDGSLLLKMMGGQLENKGYHVSLTDSPEEALVWLSTRHVVLVVMKLNGQQTDRLAVMHMVKELNRGTKLIIMGESGHLSPEMLELEAEDYILLPCRAAAIWRRLLATLNTASAQPARSAKNDLVHPVNWRVLNKLGLMFHDLRGQLTSISEGLKTLRRRTNGRLDNEVEAIFQDTFRKSRTVIRMAEEFLQKIQHQNPALSSNNLVDLREEVVGPILEELKHEVHKNCITFINRLSLLPPAQHMVRGDPVALRSVFRHLLQNAITYGGYGCTICIELDEAPTHVRLRVQNRDEPLSSKRRPEMFTRVKEDRENGQGIDLGLSLGREVMQSQGGDISYESCRQGAKFIMTLPRA
jgi:signal transduction histidine kinase